MSSSSLSASALFPSNTRTYDPNIIIRAANDKLAGGDLVGGQTLFQSALLNWVDDAREGGGPTTIASSNANVAVDADTLKEAIGTLWIAYAQYLQSAKQYKSATEAFEQAVDCPIGGTMGRVWLEYARFLEERSKLRTAQQVYLRALVKPRASDGMAGAVQDEQDRNLLWNEFLELSRNTTDNPDLTLRELQQAIQEEHEQQMEDEPVTKRPRLTGTVHQEYDYHDDNVDDGPVIRTHVVTSSDVELELQTLQEALESVPNDPTFMAAWLVRDGDAPPQPPSFPLFEAAPPKLSDPTGKDLLGEDLALAVVSRLLEPSGGVALQVCRALWMWTLLKEQNAQKQRDALDDSIMDQYGQVQARLEERLSVAGAAEAAVRTMNQQELQAFESKVQDERRDLWNKLAWEARQVQWAIQQVLHKLQMPGFVDHHDTMNSTTTGAGTTVDPTELQYQAKVCAYLHSAFFLRRRIGDKAHDTMLASQKDRLQQFVVAAAAQRLQQQQQHQHQQQTQSHVGHGMILPPPPPPPPPMMVAGVVGGYPGYPPPPPPGASGYSAMMPPGALPLPPPPPHSSYGNNSNNLPPPPPSGW